MPGIFGPKRSERPMVMKMHLDPEGCRHVDYAGYLIDSAFQMRRDATAKIAKDPFQCGTDINTVSIVEVFRMAADELDAASRSTSDASTKLQLDKAIGSVMRMASSVERRSMQAVPKYPDEWYVNDAKDASFGHADSISRKMHMECVDAVTDSAALF